jgi:hypothetical protein
MIVRILFISLFTLIIGACSNKTPEDEHSIIGLWRLVGMQEQNHLSGKWNDYGKKMQGFLLYDAKGHMSLHMTIEDYEKTNLIFHDLKDSVSIDELKHRSMSYNYMAQYEIDHDKHIITHHRISHSNPTEWNTSVKREMIFSSDTLILTTLDRDAGKIRVKWLRDIN